MDVQISTSQTGRRLFSFVPGFNNKKEPQLIQADCE